MVLWTNLEIWRNEHLKPRMFLCNGTMNASEYWQRRNEHSAILATARWCLTMKKVLLKFNIFKHLCCLSYSLSSFCVACNTERRNVSIVLSTKVVQTLFRCWQWCYEFHPRVGIFLFPNSGSKKGGALNFKGLSQEGGRTDFSENLGASLFNDELSTYTFKQIHLAG